MLKQNQLKCPFRFYCFLPCIKEPEGEGKGVEDYFQKRSSNES